MLNSNEEMHNDAEKMENTETSVNLPSMGANLDTFFIAGISSGSFMST